MGALLLTQAFVLVESINKKKFTKSKKKQKTDRASGGEMDKFLSKNQKIDIDEILAREAAIHAVSFCYVLGQQLPDQEGSLVHPAQSANTSNHFQAINNSYPLFFYFYIFVCEVTYVVHGTKAAQGGRAMPRTGVGGVVSDGLL